MHMCNYLNHETSSKCVHFMTFWDEIGVILFDCLGFFIPLENIPLQFVIYAWYSRPFVSETSVNDGHLRGSVILTLIAERWVVELSLPVLWISSVAATVNELGCDIFVKSFTGYSLKIFFSLSDSYAYKLSIW